MARILGIVPVDGTADPTVEIDGVSLPEHAARALLDSGRIERVVLRAGASTVVPLRTAGDSTLIVRPLPERIRELRQQAEFVLVHDPLRALTPVGLIRSVIDTVCSGTAAAAVPAVPVTDTIKIVDSGAALRGTWERQRLREIQSPVCCRTELLPADDVRVPTLSDLPAEQVRLLPGDPLGMRISTPIDRLVATELRDRAQRC